MNPGRNLPDKTQVFGYGLDQDFLEQTPQCMLSEAEHVLLDFNRERLVS